jgi:hypothetical protein
LKLKCVEPLSNVAFNFNVRRYMTVFNELLSLGRAVLSRLNPVDARVESAWFQRLKPRYDESLSKFAFNFKLRPYS